MSFEESGEYPLKLLYKYVPFSEWYRVGLPPVLGRASVKDRMGSPVSVRFISWNCCAVFDDNKLDTLESWIRLENPWIQNDAVDFDVVVVRSRASLGLSCLSLLA